MKVVKRRKKKINKSRNPFETFRSGKKKYRAIKIITVPLPNAYRAHRHSYTPWKYATSRAQRVRYPLRIHNNNVTVAIARAPRDNLARASRSHCGLRDGTVTGSLTRATYSTRRTAAVRVKARSIVDTGLRARRPTAISPRYSRVAATTASLARRSSPLFVRQPASRYRCASAVEHTPQPNPVSTYAHMTLCR